MKMLQFLALLAAGLFTVLSCNSNPEDASTSRPGIPESILYTAKTTATVDQANYTAAVFPYRDFMPGHGESMNERGLIAIARICRSDSLEVPQTLHLKYIWTFQGRERWGAQLGEERQDFRGNFCRAAVARGGPQWEPGTKVDVVIGFTVGDSGMYTVRTATTTIERAE